MLYELKGLGGSVNKLRVNRQLTYLYAASSNSIVKIYDLNAKAEKSQLKAHREPINNIVLSHDE